MIDKKELRIGNNVYYGTPNKAIVTVNNISDTGINRVEEYDEDDNGNTIPDISEYAFEHLNPIKLTPEILEKWCGFEKWFVEDHEINDVYEKSIDDDLSIEITSLKNGDFVLCVRVDEYRLSKPFRFIHQLQNICFDLTGEELTISQMVF